MSEALLRARLITLRRNLTVTRSVSTKEKSDLVLAEELEPEVWKTAFGQVAHEAQQLEFEIDDLETDLESTFDVAEAWSRYRGIRDGTQRICRDCLELVGGFALREKLLEDADDHLLDRRVTVVTEAIGQICRTAYLDLRGMVALPAPEDAVSVTAARIVRARFPEWTVWTLPAAAYEYGHVVLREIEPIRDASKEERRLRLGSENLTERSAKGKRRGQQLQAHLDTLYADAFAARVMGPAYAAAMIVLRLDPARQETEFAPSDRDRAATILEVIRRAYPPGEPGSDIDAPWRWVRDQVEPQWEEMCQDAGTQAGKRGIDPEAPKDRAQAFIERNWGTALRNGILPDALYDYKSFDKECWTSARALAKHWTDRLDGGEDGELPTIRGVRDILNAAWICRISHPKAGKTLTLWARGACDAFRQQEPVVPTTDKPEVRQKRQVA